MSKYTTNLNLFEFESTDGSSTFNIDTCLNDNWDKIDNAVSALQVIQVVDKVLTVGGWSLVGGIYQQSISDSNILPSSIVDVIPSNTNTAIVRSSKFLPTTNSSTGRVMVYCENLPLSNITVTINIRK